MSVPSPVPGLIKFEQRLTAKRQLVAQVLAKPVRPVAAQAREAYFEKIKNAVANRQKIVSAYSGALSNHFKAFRQMLEKPRSPSAGSGVKTGGGGFGESA